MEELDNKESRKQEIRIESAVPHDYPEPPVMDPNRKKGPWGGVVVAVVAVLCFGGGIMASRVDFDALLKSNEVSSGQPPAGAGQPPEGEPAPNPEAGSNDTAAESAAVKSPAVSAFTQARNEAEDHFYKRFKQLNNSLSTEEPGLWNQLKRVSGSAKAEVDDQRAVQLWSDALAVVSSLEAVQAAKEKEQRMAAERRKKDAQAAERQGIEIAEAKEQFMQLLNAVDASACRTYAAEAWALVLSGQTKAEAAGEKVEAISLWKTAAEQLRKAEHAVEAALEIQRASGRARAAYVARRDAVSKEDWLRYGGSDWLEVQQLERKAVSEDRAGRYDWAKKHYTDALDKLSALEPKIEAGKRQNQISRNAAERRREYKALLKDAEFALGKKDYQELAAIIEKAKNCGGADDNGSYIRNYLEPKLEVGLQNYRLGKENYDSMVSGFDLALLNQFGGKEWRDAQENAAKGEEYKYVKDMTKRYYQYAQDYLKDLPYTVMMRAVKHFDEKEMWAELRDHITKARDTIDKDPNGRIIGLDPETIQTRHHELDEKSRKLPFETSTSVWMANLGNGVFADFIRVEPGRYDMGSGFFGEEAEKPKHEVVLSAPFWLMNTEVTQEQYREIMAAHNCRFNGAKRPVESIRWQDAMDFCRFLTERERASRRIPMHYEYTLPTEAQWEYACRAGTSGKYAGKIEDMAWYAENSGARTHDVATTQANPWGFYDMHGNVWEWCRDFSGDYRKGSFTDPEFKANTGEHIIRGGSWNAHAERCRSASRLKGTLRDKTEFIGFRPALVPVQ